MVLLVYMFFHIVEVVKMQFCVYYSMVNPQAQSTMMYSRDTSLMFAKWENEWIDEYEIFTKKTAEEVRCKFPLDPYAIHGLKVLPFPSSKAWIGEKSLLG